MQTYLRILYRSYRKTVPVWYLFSILFGVFVFFSRRGSDDTVDDIEHYSFNDQYKQDISEPNSVLQLAKNTQLEEFPFSSDTSVLPIAPYKNIEDKLDFRATLEIYLDVVKDSVDKSVNGKGGSAPVFSFDWKDFVDLNILKPLLKEKPNCFTIGALGATSRIPWENCLDEPQNLGFVFITPSLEPETEFRLSIRGKSYLYSAAPLPKKLIFLAGELSFVTRVNKKSSLLENKMIDEYVQRKILAFPELKREQLLKAPINPNHQIKDISKILNRGLVNFEAEKLLDINVDSSSFQFTADPLKAKLANEARHYDDKHFRNVLLKTKDGQWVSEEFYDWRFFNKKLSNLNKRKALHSITENFLQFCSNLGYKAWLAGDSLTSTQYNGLISPWEDTVKFEMPAEDLTKMTQSFNYSLILSDPRNDTGSYLIDISPWYLQRAIYNDGGAAPDAADTRIIDTKTGIYIEINGVVEAPRIPPDMLERTSDKDISNYVVSGKGNFWYLPELLPLQRIIYEGKVANIPKTIPQDYLKPPAEYIYRDHLRLFVEEGKCSYVPEEEKENFDLSYIGCCHDNIIWKEYNSTKFATLNFKKITGLPVNVLNEVDINFT